MRILELTGEPIGTGGQEMFIINLLRHIDLTDLQIKIGLLLIIVRMIPIKLEDKGQSFVPRGPSS